MKGVRLFLTIFYETVSISNNEWYNVRESGSHVERIEARQGLTGLVVV